MFSASVWSVKLFSASVWSTDSDFSVWLRMVSSVFILSVKLSSVSVWSMDSDFSVRSVDGVFSVCEECGWCLQRV